MINPTTSFPTPATDSSRFPTGVQQRIDRPESSHVPHVEEIVANHTAIKPSRALCASYALESVLTGSPLLVVDLLTTSGGLILASYLVSLSQGQLINPGIFLQLPVLLMLQALMMSIHQLYPGAGLSPVAELRGIFRSTSFSLLCLAAMNVMLGQLPRIELATLACSALLVSLTLPLTRWSTRDLLARTRWWGIRILLIGRREDCIATFRLLSHRRSTGFIPCGYACESADVGRYSQHDQRLLGTIAEAGEVARRHLTPVAGLVSQQDRYARTDRLIFQFPSVVVINLPAVAREGVNLSNLPDLFTTRLNMPFLQFIPRITKRIVDLMICIPALTLLALPLGLIALSIKCCSPGPVIYGSRRVGQHGKMFQMWKFRSMVPSADQVLQRKLDSDPEARREWETHSKLKSDPRIIPIVGNLLRRWSLDELPQLWNVLMGEMSLVGPRPVPPNEIVRYQHHYHEYTQMWPGMTGLWQVSGRNDTSFETRVFLVHQYARHWSPWLDLLLLLKTPAAVISRKGAY